MLNPENVVIASGSNINTGDGSIVTLSGLTFTVDGTYTIQVEAPSSRSSSTGNYVISLYDITPHVTPLVLGQQENGQLVGQYGVDQWSFSAAANEQVEFDLVSDANNLVNFNLIGPGGYTAFSGLQGNSGLITLPSNGTYILSADGLGGNGASYSFQLNELTILDLTPGTPYSSTSTGTGYSQLYEVNIASVQTLFMNMNDSTTTDVNGDLRQTGLASDAVELRVSQHGRPRRPTRPFWCRRLLTGTWYILVYSRVGTSSQQLYGRRHRPPYNSTVWHQVTRRPAARPRSPLKAPALTRPSPSTWSLQAALFMPRRRFRSTSSPKSLRHSISQMCPSWLQARPIACWSRGPMVPRPNCRMLLS